MQQIARQAIIYCYTMERRHRRSIACGTAPESRPLEVSNNSLFLLDHGHDL
jgi:hypothetical protein